MLDESQLEQNRRRRDTGSGLSFELFDAEILQFIFHDIIRKRLLNSFSGLDNFSEDSEQITWNEKWGIATKEDTDELVFLGASSSDKVLIKNILVEDGALVAVSTLSQDSSGLSEESGKLTFEAVINVIDQALQKLGPLIKICTANGYRACDFDLFRKDHIRTGTDSVPKKRLVAYYTKDTQQGKIIVESYYVGKGKTDKAGSHPGMVDKKTLKAFKEKQSGPFSLAARYLNAYTNG